jgi:hypothetical protein
MLGDYINDLIDKIKDKTFDLIRPNEEQKKDILEFFGVLTNPFDFLSTAYKQQNLIEETGFYVAPQRINLGKRDEVLLRNENTIIVCKDITFEYVSIYATLEKLFQNKDFLNTIQLYATKNLEIQATMSLICYLKTAKT